MASVTETFSGRLGYWWSMIDSDGAPSPSSEGLPRPDQTTPVQLEAAQLRLHRQLLLLGMAPARGYEDACRIASGSVGLATASHLLFHLAREIDGHIRQVCGTLSEAETPRRRGWLIWRRVEDDSGGGGAKESIQRAAVALGFDPADELISEWHELVSRRFYKYAHRGDLGGPRPIDADLLRTWDETQRVWSIVLDRLEGRIADFHRRLNELIERETPGKQDLRVLRQRIPNNHVTLGYFFDRLDKPGWLSPLQRAGMFAHPPPVVPGAAGLQAPPWPQASYLQRMADQDPVGVVKILQDLPHVENPTVLEQLATVAVALPSKEAAGLIGIYSAWLETPFNKTLLTMRITELVQRFLAEGFSAEAIRLSRELLRIKSGSD